jgi:translation elongation factor EF-Ts
VNYDNSTTVIEKYIEDMTLQNQNIEKKQKKTIDNITNKHNYQLFFFVFFQYSGFVKSYLLCIFQSQ